MYRNWNGRSVNYTLIMMYSVHVVKPAFKKYVSSVMYNVYQLNGYMYMYIIK